MPFIPIRSLHQREKRRFLIKILDYLRSFTIKDHFRRLLLTLLSQTEINCKNLASFHNNFSSSPHAESRFSPSFNSIKKWQNVSQRWKNGMRKVFRSLAINFSGVGGSYGTHGHYNVVATLTIADESTKFSTPSSGISVRFPRVRIICGRPQSNVSVNKSQQRIFISYSLSFTSSFTIRNAINLFSIHGNIIGFDLDIKFCTCPAPTRTTSSLSFSQVTNASTLMALQHKVCYTFPLKPLRLHKFGINELLWEILVVAEVWTKTGNWVK